MLSRIVAGLFLAVALLGAPCAGQAVAPSVPPLLNRAVRSGWMRLAVDQGRLRLVIANVGQIKPPAVSQAWEENLNLTARDGRGVLEYDLKLPDCSIQIRGEADGPFSLTRKPAERSPVLPLEFSQRPGEPLRLAVGPPAEQRVATARTFWHLLLGHPAETESLMPILRWLAGDGVLAPSALELEESLVRLAIQRLWSRRPQWEEWVRQLADERFAVRESADRNLRSAGAAVIPFLQEIDFAQLDAEQQYRLRRIRLALQQETNPSSAQYVATSLLGDRDVWLILLGREQESVRRAASEQLGLILGKPIAFDPAADPATRQKQWDALRGTLGKP